jgi:hypothetical protein
MYTGTLINDLLAAVERVRERAEKSVRPRQWPRQTENRAAEAPGSGAPVDGSHEVEHERAGNSEPE